MAEIIWWTIWGIWMAYVTWNILLLFASMSWTKKATRCYENSIDLMDGMKNGTWDEIEEIVEANDRIAKIYQEKAMYYKKCAYMPWRFRGRAR